MAEIQLLDLKEKLFHVLPVWFGLKMHTSKKTCENRVWRIEMHHRAHRHHSPLRWILSVDTDRDAQGPHNLLEFHLMLMALARPCVRDLI